MDRFTILIMFLLGAVQVNISDGLLFPTSDIITWSPLRPDQIDCNYTPKTKPFSGGTKLAGYLPVLKHSYIIPGFVCEAITLSLKCHKSFFGSLDLTYIEHHPTLSKQSCIEAVSQYKMGHTDTPVYPAPDCVWLSFSTSSKTFIKVTPVELPLNPYTGSVMSEMFPHNECNVSYCYSIYDNKAWVPDSHSPPPCISDHLDTTIFFVKTYEKGVVDIWSPDLNIATGHQICIKTYCGMDGLLFHDGSWIGMKSENITLKETQLNDYFYDLPICPTGRTLSQTEGHHTVHVAEKNILSRFLETECEKTKEKLLVNDGISRVELQSLTPQVPGIHKVYRLNNLKLEMGISFYQEVTLIPPMSNNPIIVKTSWGKIIKWKYWTFDEVHKVYDGPNGIFISNGSVQSVLHSINDYQRSLVTSLQLKTNISAPGQYKNINLLHSTNGTYMFSHQSAESLETKVQKWSQTLWWSIAKYFLAGLIALGALFLLLNLGCWGIKTLMERRTRNRRISAHHNVLYKPA